MDNDNQLPPAPVAEEQEPEKASDDVALFFEVITSGKSGLTHLVALPDEMPVTDGVYHVHMHGRQQPAIGVDALSEFLESNGFLGYSFGLKERPQAARDLSIRICNWIEEQKQ